MVCSFAKDKNFCHMHQLKLLYLKRPIYYTHPLVNLLVFTSPRLIIGCLQYLFIVVQIQGQTLRNAFAYRVVNVLSVNVLHSFFQLLVLHMKPWL